MEEKEKIHKKNSIVSFNRRLFVDEKLKTIKYTEERSVQAASNYYIVSKPAIYGLKMKN